MKKIFIAFATASLLITSNAQISAEEEAEITVNGGEVFEEANLVNDEAITAVNEGFVSEEAEIIPPTTTEEIFYPAEEVTLFRDEEGELSDNNDGNGDDTDTDNGNTVSPGFLGGKILATSASAFFAVVTLVMM